VHGRWCRVLVLLLLLLLWVSHVRLDPGDLLIELVALLLYPGEAALQLGRRNGCGRGRCVAHHHVAGDWVGLAHRARRGRREGRNWRQGGRL
jgi:hypothetical protein